MAEAANGPTTFAAQKWFDSKHIPVIPDFVLNAGGVTVSYFEWLKNLEHQRLGRLTKRWESKSTEALIKVLGIELPPKATIKEGPSEKQIVYTALQESMATAVNQVFEKSLELNCSLRLAGFILGIQRISQCYDDAGIF